MLLLFRRGPVDRVRVKGSAAPAPAAKPAVTRWPAPPPSLNAVIVNNRAGDDKGARRGTTPASTVDQGVIVIAQDPSVPVVARWPATGAITRLVKPAVNRWPVAAARPAMRSSGLMLALQVPVGPAPQLTLNRQAPNTGSTENVPTPVAPGDHYTDTPSGGLSWSGSALDVFTAAQSPSGGLSWSGSALDVVAYAQSPAGGLALAGSTLDVVAYAQSPSGGLSWAGSALDVIAYGQSPSGGLTWIGTALDLFSTARSPSGGISWSGSALDAVAHAQSPSGGLSWSGATSDLYVAAWSPSGGISLGGSALDVMSYASDPSGGVALSGHAADLFTGADLIFFVEGTPVDTAVIEHDSSTSVTVEAIAGHENAVYVRASISAVVEAVSSGEDMFVRQRSRITVKFRANGVAFDPTSLRLTYSLPDQGGGQFAKVITDYGDGDIVRVAAGEYYLAVFPKHPGTIFALWESRAVGEETAVSQNVPVTKRPTIR